MDCGLIDGSGIAVDVDEFGVGEHFQQRGNSIGVRGGLHDAHAFASHCQFFDQRQQRVFPDGAFFGSHFGRVQKPLVDAHATLKCGHEVGGQGGPDSEGDFIFLRSGPCDFDVVHRAFFGQQPFGQRRHDLLSQQEVSGEQAFVEIEEGESWVERHEVVQHGGAAAPVPKDKDGRFADGCSSDAATVEHVFGGVHQAVEAGHETSRDQAIEVTDCDLGFQAEEFVHAAERQSLPEANAIAGRQICEGFHAGIAVLAAAGRGGRGACGGRLRGGTGGLDSGRHNTSSPHADYWLNGGAHHRCAYEILFRLNYNLFSADFAEWWPVVRGMPEKWFRDEWWLCQWGLWGDVTRLGFRF